MYSRNEAYSRVQTRNILAPYQNSLTEPSTYRWTFHYGTSEVQKAKPANIKSATSSGWLADDTALKRDNVHTLILLIKIMQC